MGLPLPGIERVVGPESVQNVVVTAPGLARRG